MLKRAATAMALAARTSVFIVDLLCPVGRLMPVGTERSRSGLRPVYSQTRVSQSVGEKFSPPPVWRRPARRHVGRQANRDPIIAAPPEEGTMAQHGKSSDVVGAWRKLAEAELRGKPVDGLAWQTPEGITVKPLYTAADLAEIDAAGFPLRDAVPGAPPYLRGPRATMYANRPWTVRQYSGFSTAEESNRF